MKAAFNFVCVFPWHLKGRKEQNHNAHLLRVSKMITATFFNRSHTSWKWIFFLKININLRRQKLIFHKVTVLLFVAWSNRACRKAWSMAICSVINPDLTCSSADTCRRLNGVAKYAIKVFCNCLWPQLSVLVWARLVQKTGSVRFLYLLS